MKKITLTALASLLAFASISPSVHAGKSYYSFSIDLGYIFPAGGHGYGHRGHGYGHRGHGHAPRRHDYGHRGHGHAPRRHDYGHRGHGYG
ncbi:MAG: hypothetical protein P8Y12_06310, partial [Gammaproteobacteria bacterium]